MDVRDRVLHVAISPPDTNDSATGAGQSKGSACACQNGSRPAASLDTLSRLLSVRNINLLKLIKEKSPQSVAELARLSGRPKASLTLTLRRLEQFGIVSFKGVNGRRKMPVVSCDRLMLEVSIDTPSGDTL